MRRLAQAIALLLGLAAPPAQAQGAADVAAFQNAVTLSAAGDWDGAEAAMAGGGALARDLVTWMRLREGRDAGATFPACAALVAARPHWPGLDRLRARCEEVMPDGMPPDQVLAWFTGAKPQTGAGAVQLVAALAAQGRTEEAAAQAQDAWLTLGFSDGAQAALLLAQAETLAPLHWQRAQTMLWRERTADADRMLPLLTADQRLLARARIAMIRGADDRHRRVADVPAALLGDAGLAYDRYTRLADQGDFSDAVALLMARTDSAAALVEPFRWAAWRATLARWALREGRPRDAYAIASRHHLTEGEFFSDLEWVAGYVALRHLADPATALRHFRAMDTGSPGPISVARAAYWQGRALEALGQDAGAAYARAAGHQVAFYGLLAAERLGLPLDPALAGTEAFPDWRQGDFLRSDLAAAMLMLIAADRRNEAVLFALKQAQVLDRTGIGQLGTMLTEMNEPFYAVTVAKEAAARGIVIPAIYFPLHPLAQMASPVEPALSLAIARRESEFNPGAGSPVGAMGLMQLMPGTAEEVAGQLGLPYERGRLLTDWAYNATLGTTYLAGLQRSFGLSPVLVAAGYNAGPGRPRQWITQRGDPREADVDVIDWIESIPFAETRTYVMRVTESIPAYRARLGGQTGVVAFSALLHGTPAVPRPPVRPPRGAAPVADVAQALAEAVATPAATPAGSVHAPLRALRPPVRP